MLVFSYCICISHGPTEKQNQWDVYICVHIYMNICMTFVSIYSGNRKVERERRIEEMIKKDIFSKLVTIIMESRKSKICRARQQQPDDSGES